MQLRPYLPSHRGKEKENAFDSREQYVSNMLGTERYEVCASSKCVSYVQRWLLDKMQARSFNLSRCWLSCSIAKYSINVIINADLP